MHNFTGVLRNHRFRKYELTFKLPLLVSTNILSTIVITVSLNDFIKRLLIVGFDTNKNGLEQPLNSNFQVRNMNIYN